MYGSSHLQKTSVHVHTVVAEIISVKGTESFATSGTTLKMVVDCTFHGRCQFHQGLTT